MKQEEEDQKGEETHMICMCRSHKVCAYKTELHIKESGERKK